MNCIAKVQRLVQHGGWEIKKDLYVKESESTPLLDGK